MMVRYRILAIHLQENPALRMSKRMLAWYAAYWNVFLGMEIYFCVNKMWNNNSWNGTEYKGYKE
eukprot:136480-Pelagomonas_calceolata.AAC.1